MFHSLTFLKEARNPNFYVKSCNLKILLLIPNCLTPSGPIKSALRCDCPCSLLRVARPGWPFQATSQHRKQPPWRPHSSGSTVVTELTHGTAGLFPSTSGLQSIQRTPSPTLASWAPPAAPGWEPRPKFPSLRSCSSDQHVRPRSEKQLPQGLWTSRTAPEYALRSQANTEL